MNRIRRVAFEKKKCMRVYFRGVESQGRSDFGINGAVSENHPERGSGEVVCRHT